MPALWERTVYQRKVEEIRCVIYYLMLRGGVNEENVWLLPLRGAALAPGESHCLASHIRAFEIVDCVGRVGARRNGPWEAT